MNVERYRYLLLAAAIFLTNGAALAAPPPPAPPALFGPDAQVVELGTLAVGESRLQLFAWTNATPATARVRAVESSCDCLAILDYPRELESGAVGLVIVNVFGEKPGDFAYAAALELEDGTQRFFVTQVRVPAPAGVALPAPLLAPSRVARTWRPGAPQPIDPEVMRRVTYARDRALYRLPDTALLAAVRGGAIRVVDLRAAEAVAAQSIPGALNILPSAVPEKGFLRQGPVLLVDEGWGGVTAERACRGLRAAGNGEAAILQGGMAAWARLGGALTGTAVAPASLSQISPRAFLGVRGGDDWVVAYGGTNAAAAARLLHEAVPLAAARPAAWQRLLLLDGDATPPAAAGAVVFHLQGGLDALAREYRELTAMRHSQTLSTTRQVTGRRWEVIRAGCGCK